MIKRLYIAYNLSDAEWLVAHPEILDQGLIIYSGIEAHLVLQSANIFSQDAVDFYRQLDWETICNESEKLHRQFEPALRQICSDYKLPIVYRDVDTLDCVFHLLYYFFLEVVVSSHLAAAIIEHYQPQEIWVNQSPLTPVTQWGLAPPPFVNYENQVWSRLNRENLIIKPLAISSEEPTNISIKQYYKSQFQSGLSPEKPQYLDTESDSNLQSDILIALQNNFIRNYAPIGEDLAKLFTTKTLDLNQNTLWHGWYGNSNPLHFPLGDIGNTDIVPTEMILNDDRFFSIFSDYSVDIWPIIRPRIDLLLNYELPNVRAYIERSEWILKEVSPKLIIMAEEVSLLARTLGAVANLQGIKTLIIQHGSASSADSKLSGKERPYRDYWLYNYSDTRPDYIAVWGDYGRRYFLQTLRWSDERVMATGWPWIEKEIRPYLNSSIIRPKNHISLQLLFLSTSTWKFSHYLYQPLFEAVKYFNAELIIRPHGAENINYLENLASLVNVNVRIDNKTPLLEQITDSDIVMGGATSVLSYAIALGKPAIFVDLLPMRDYLPYALEGAAIGVYDPEELIPAIEKLLNDPEERYRQQIKQKLFTQQYLGSLDGKATERIINFIKTKLNMQNKLSISHLQSIAKTDKLCVDIGCGDHKPKNFIGVDIAPGIGVDIVADISKEFPFSDSSIDELRAHDIIEHLPDRINTMNEIWRVCKPGAKVDIRVPSTDGRGAFQDPTHISFWNINSFLYYCNEYPAYLELCKKYGFKGEFNAIHLEHEESPGGVIHVIAQLRVVKSDVNLKKQEIPENTQVIQQYQQLIKENEHLRFLFSSQFDLKEIGEAHNYYQRFENSIDYLHTSIFNSPDSELWHEVVKNFAKTSNFTPVYFNEENLKDIYVKRAEIIEYFLKLQGYEIDYEFTDRPINRKKIRLGILAKLFLPSAETYAYLPVYEYLSRDFEVILYSFAETGHPLEQYCQLSANSLKVLPQELSAQVNMIRDDDIDILFIATNITITTNQICLLASHRLARIQVTSGGSVVTTGMRNIDYYISGTLTDPSPTAQEQYQEKLIKLEGSAHCFSYGTEEGKITTPVERSNLGIPEDAFVFISCANYFKTIPELVETWTKIISQVPNSVLVLLPFGPNWSHNYPKLQFINHLNSVFIKYGLEPECFIVLDPQPVPDREDMKEYYKIADVYLDSFPFAGTTSLIEPLQVNLPVIARQGNCFRSAMGAAMIQTLNISDLVADSEESYIKLAVALGNNAELCQQKSDEIKAAMNNNPSFLDSRAYSAKMGNLFQELFRNYLSEKLEQNLHLRDINLIIFPDWTQSEDELGFELQEVIQILANHPENEKITLMIHTGNIATEDVEMFLSSVAMNLLMEDLDITETIDISLVSNLGDMQWQLLLPRIYGRIKLNHEYQPNLTTSLVDKLTVYQLDNFQLS